MANQTNIFDMLQISLEEHIRLRKRELLRYKQLCMQASNQLNPEQKFSLAIRILKLFSNDRLDEENQILIGATQEFQFFKELNQKQSNVTMRLHEQCCQKMTYKRFSQGQTVFYQGDMPDSCYIILRGSVNIFITKTPQAMEEEITSEEHRNKPEKKHLYAVLNKLSKTRFDDQSLFHIKQVLEENESMSQEWLATSGGIPIDQFQSLSKLITPKGVFKWKLVNFLNEGQMFGDKGLLLTKPRSATVVCKEKCEFAVLSAEAYRKVLQNAEIVKMNAQVEFLQQTIFQGCLKETVVKNSYHFVKKKYLRDQYLYREGEEPKQIYLVKSGIIQISKNIEGVSHIQDTLSCENLLRQVEGKPEKLIKRKNYTQTALAQLERGMSFGDYDIVFDLPQRQYSALCYTEKSTVYVLNRQQFMLILQENPFLFENFQSSGKEKEDFFQNQILNYKFQQNLQIESSKNLNNHSLQKIKTKKRQWKVKTENTEQIDYVPNSHLITVDRTEKQVAQLEGYLQRKFNSSVEQNLIRHNANEQTNQMFQSLKQMHQEKQQLERFFRIKVMDYTQYAKMTPKTSIQFKQTSSIIKSKKSVPRIHQLPPNEIYTSTKTNFFPSPLQVKFFSSKSSSTMIRPLTQDHISAQDNISPKSGFYLTQNFDCDNFGSNMKEIADENQSIKKKQIKPKTHLSQIDFFYQNTSGSQIVSQDQHKLNKNQLVRKLCKVFEKPKSNQDGLITERNSMTLQDHLKLSRRETNFTKREKIEMLLRKQ